MMERSLAWTSSRTVQPSEGAGHRRQAASRFRRGVADRPRSLGPAPDETLPDGLRPAVEKVC